MTSAAELRGRWIGQERRIAAIVSDIQNDRDWTQRLGAWPDNEMPALAHLESCPRKIEGLPVRDLRGITLTNIDLSEKTGLADTELDFAVFDNVQLQKASLRGSSLKGAVFKNGSALNETILQLASLQMAHCRDISLQGADLRGAKLQGCDFRGADLRGAQFARARIKEEGTFGFLSIRRGWTKFGGELQTFKNISDENSLSLRKHIARSSRIEEMKKDKPVYSWFFWLFANYGRSAARFGLFAFIGCWLFFALLYATLPLPDFLRGTDVGHWLQSRRHPDFAIGGHKTELDFIDAMYLSAVTITTLGYGDIVPAAGDGYARFLVTAEAITGVIILGAFINMLVQNAAVEGD